MNLRERGVTLGDLLIIFFVIGISFFIFTKNDNDTNKKLSSQLMGSQTINF